MSAKFKVVISDYTYEDPSREKAVLEPIGAEVLLYDDRSDEERIAHCHDADAIICEMGPFRRNVIEKLERCKAIVGYGAGYEHIDLNAATEKGIVCTNTPGYGNEEVSDHALALMYACARKIVKGNRIANAGLQDWSFRPLRTIYRLKGRTVGVVGIGRIGSTFARKVKALGYRVIYYDPYVPAEKGRECGAEKVSLEMLMKESDFISIHCLHNTETHHLIGRKQLEMMKPTAYIVNTARGGIIDQEALTVALESDRIAGAGLDVHEQEPPSPQVRERLFKLDNVITTPHSAWYSQQAMYDRQSIAATTAKTILLGGRPDCVVNPAVYK
jgi:D-3-phosphoglycerate dehydrogenase